MKLKEDGDKRPKLRQDTRKEESEFVEEMDSDEETAEVQNDIPISSKSTLKDTKNITIKKEGAIDKPEEIEKDDIKYKTNTTVSEKIKEENLEDNTEAKRVFGPMRPPENYVIPEGYFDQKTDRDLPEIEEKE